MKIVSQKQHKKHIYFIKSENRAYWLMEKPVSGNVIKSIVTNG